jgi:hypothetical protein
MRSSGSQSTALLSYLPVRGELATDTANRLTIPRTSLFNNQDNGVFGAIRGYGQSQADSAFGDNETGNVVFRATDD